MFSDGIVFSSFDFLQGPIVVYKNIPDELAKKISLKVLYATLTGHNSQIEGHEKTITSSSVIPMQEDNLIVFVYVFPLVDPKLGSDNVRVSSLCLVSDIENKKLIYQSAPKLEEYSKNLVEYLKDNFIFDQPMNERTIKKLLDITAIPNEILRDSLSKKVAVSIISKRERKELKRIKILKPFQPTQQIDKLIFGLFAYQKFLFVHPNYSVYIDDLLDLCDFISFYRNLQLSECQEEFVLDEMAPDMQIGTKECLGKNINKIDLEKFIIVDLETETVRGGKNNEFFKNYFQGKTHMFTDHLFYSFVESDFRNLTKKWNLEVEKHLKPQLEIIDSLPEKKIKNKLKNLIKDLQKQYSEGEVAILFQFMILKYPKLTKSVIKKKTDDNVLLESNLIPIMV